MLAPRTRAAIRIGSLLYLALGLVLFAAPEFAASAFPWSVGSLVAMTIGGWMLGNGAALWFASAPGPASRVMPVLAYVAAFAALELLIAIAFRGALQLDALLAIPYLLTLVVSLIASAFGMLELRNSTDVIASDDAPLPTLHRRLLLGLLVFVTALGVGGFLAGDGGLSTTGRIFPQPLTLFTVRAFAAFYLALAVGIGALLLRPGIGSAMVLGIAGIALIIPILLAAILHLGAFDFAGRPLGILYLAAYAVVLVPSLVFVVRHRETLGRF
ncbi:MAG TPA: hypothetical protein VJ850_12065 [Candidatus Limnocylindrales bacterium]|nr:hypothetical protein [Candidatus Limnocylindrales bacterium]